MRHILIVSITTIVAMVGVSCDPKVLEVTEKEPPVAEIQPELALVYSDIEQSAELTVYDDILISDCGDEILLKVENASDTLTYSLYCADESTISLKWEEKSAWIITAKQPGISDIRIIVTTSDGTAWEYIYKCAVFGHITIESKCDPVEKTAGFIIGEIEYEGLRADMYVNMRLIGSPWGLEEFTHTVKLESIRQVLPLYSSEDYSHLFDLEDAFGEIYALDDAESPDGDNLFWGPDMLKMDIVVSLNNPYIIIDDIIDDRDREHPDYINFDTEVTFRQEGLVTIKEYGSDGWVNQNVDVCL